MKVLALEQEGKRGYLFLSSHSATDKKKTQTVEIFGE